MQHEKITPQLWMLLSKPVREHLTLIFKVPRSGVTEVRDQELITDGRTMIDLESISHVAMTEYIGSEETFGRAFELTLAKVKSELNPPVGAIATKQQAADSMIVKIEPIEQVVVEEVVIEVPANDPGNEKTNPMEVPKKKKSYYVPVAERKAKQNGKKTD